MRAGKRYSRTLVGRRKRKIVVGFTQPEKKIQRYRKKPKRAGGGARMTESGEREETKRTKEGGRGKAD